MFNYSAGNHDKEHERIIRLLRAQPQPYTALPAVTAANAGQRGTVAGIDYYSDGTRWLSTQLFSLAIPINKLMPFTTGAGAIVDAAVGWEILPEFTLAGFNGIYLRQVTVGYLTFNVQSAVNKLTFRLYSEHGLVANPKTITGTADTSSAVTTSFWYNFDLLNAPIVLSNLDHSVQLSFDQAGAAQNCRITTVISYRLIG